MLEEEPENVDLLNNSDENPATSGFCSWMYSYASCVAVPFVTAAKKIRSTPSKIKRYFDENPEVIPTTLMRYTAVFEFLASGFNGWGVGQTIQAILDAFIDTSSHTKFLGVSLYYVLIPCTSLSYAAGLGASLTHSYTNKKYAQILNNSDTELSMKTKAYIIAIVAGDFYDHMTNDTPTLIAALQLVWPTAPAVFNAVVYPSLYVASGVSTIKEWAPCYKNVINHFEGRDDNDDKAEEVEGSALTKFTAFWSGTGAILNGHSSGLLFVAITGTTPVLMGLSIGGIIFWSVFGLGPAVASTFAHFLVQMGYDKHSGYSHSSDTLSRGGLALVCATNFFDYAYHLLDYASSPIQIVDQALQKNGAATHLRAFTIFGIAALSGIACISEVGICQEECKQGIAKLCAKRGIFQDRSYLPNRATPLPIDKNDMKTGLAFI